MSVLAKPRILELIATGDLFVSPFSPGAVRNSSYDVSLGEYYWLENPDPRGYQYPYVARENVDSTLDYQLVDDEYASMLNMYSEESVNRMWDGPFRARPIARDLPGIAAGTPVIILNPGQNILAHTHEFIGTTDLVHTTMMKARSSLGRNQITVCRCAGMGDIGYSNRWAMEISNNGKRPAILVPGRRIAQIIFMETTGLSSQQDRYPATGKYQVSEISGKSFEDLVSGWRPESLLPQMWKDPEASR